MSRGALLLAACGILLATPSLASTLERRLESLPGESWMHPPASRLRLVAGQPSLAGESSELGLWGEFGLHPELSLTLGAELLRAGSFREERLRSGLVYGTTAWVLRLEWEGARAGVVGLIAEHRTRLHLSLALRSGPFALGLRRIARVDSAPHRPAEQMQWALRLRLDGIALALLREDALWGGEARWTAGLELDLSSSLHLGLRGDDAQGQLLLGARFRTLGLRLSLPVASTIAAGPYLALEWGSAASEVAR